MDDREKFWNSEESKEKERIADEKVRKKSEIKQLGMYIIYHFEKATTFYEIFTLLFTGTT